MARRRYSPTTGNIQQSTNTKNDNEPSQFYKFIKFLILGIIFYFLLNYMNETDPRNEFETQKFGAAGFMVLFFVRAAYHFFKSIFS
jgi:hypothetical protein